MRSIMGERKPEDKTDTQKRSRGRLSNKGTKRLYIQFQYYGQRVEYPTKDLDTPENREEWENWLNRNMARVEAGTFVYAEAFPDAKPEKKALFAKLEGKKIMISPETITLGQVIEDYLVKTVPSFPTESKRDAYKSKIRSRILPYFKNMTFADFNRNVVGKFISSLAGINHERE
jgi:integrase